MKQVIILFGAPGAGKGTQAELLADKLSLYYFETSKILEEKFNDAENLPEDSEERFVEADGKKYDILEEKRIWKKGILCSPPFVALLVKQRIRDLAEMGKNLILAGSPRTMYEGKEVMPFLAELYGKENIKIILLQISEEQTIFRNSNRRICELMRHPILFNEETKNLKFCPLDGSKLVRREGLDDPETIKVRLEKYKNDTYPLIDYFKEQGFDVKIVNGEQSVVKVHEDVLAALND